MEEQFIYYELALKLKELDFNEKCLAWYSELAYFNLASETVKPFYLHRNSCVAPLIQQARDFLREKYNKFPVVFSDGFKWTYDLRWPDLTELDNKYPGVMFPKRETEREYFDTYNEAELKAIEKIIEIEENNGTINNI